MEKPQRAHWLALLGSSDGAVTILIGPCGDAGLLVASAAAGVVSSTLVVGDAFRSELAARLAIGGA